MSDELERQDVRINLRDLGYYLIKVADVGDSASPFLEGMAVPLPPAVEGLHGVDDTEKLWQIAYMEYNERMQRAEYFHSDLLGEPAWDILLDLFIAKVSGLRISVTSSCIASHVPPTTALRWLDLLTNNGLIVRNDDVDDRRRTWVELSESGYRKMVGYLRAKGKRRAEGLSDFKFATPRVRRS